MQRGQIVTLATVVIPPENTPEKERTEYLAAHPIWQYIGPADVIRFEWQIGRWGWAGFAGDTARKYSTFSQPASMELKAFTASLPSISLSPLAVIDEPYDCEIWFKDKFSDLRVIVENCVRIVEAPPPPPPPPEWRWYPPGNFTQIGIFAPNSAIPGSRVDVEIGLINRYEFEVNMWPGRTRYDDTVFRVYDAAGRMQVVVPAGQTHTWAGYFTMGSFDTEIFVESWYEGADGLWHADYNVKQTIKRA